MKSTSLAQRISDSKYAGAREYARSFKDKAVEMLTVRLDKGRVLDVGCGTGVNSEKLAAAGLDVTGIDVSPVAIEQYRARGFDGRIGDIAAEPPCEPESFDAVFASEVIEHVADTERMLENCRTALRPGGWLVLTTPNSAFWAYRVMALLGRPLSEVQHPGHIRFFSVRSLAKALQRAGFRDVEFGGRNMYLIVPGDIAGGLLRRLGFIREHRFATGTYFHHLSTTERRPSGLWTDTMIVAARK